MAIKNIIEFFKRKDIQQHIFACNYIFIFLMAYDSLTSGSIKGWIGATCITAFLAFFKEIALDAILGTSLKLKDKVPLCGTFDKLDLIADGIGILSGYIMLALATIIL